MNIAVTEGAASRQFKAMQSAFEQAVERNAASFTEWSYTVGGRHVRIRIVGREFGKHVTQPFSHLRSDALAAVDPNLTIDLWDENETNIRCRVSTPNGNAEWKKITAISSDGRFVGQQRPNSLSCYNREAGRIINSVAWGDQLTIYERGKPLDRPLLEWHNDQHIQVIHAGLVSRHHQGVLFAGKSGSGKSTAALACLFAGFDFLSEDFVGLESLPDGSFLGHSIYNSVFLKNDQLRRFPSLGPYVMKGMPHEEKSFVILSQILPERLGRAAPIRALVLPRVVDIREPRLRPASKGEALLALGPSSFLQIPNKGLGVRGFDKMARLVERVPCYRLEVGSDLQEIPRCIEELLAAVIPL